MFVVLFLLLQAFQMQASAAPTRLPRSLGVKKAMTQPFRAAYDNLQPTFTSWKKFETLAGWLQERAPERFYELYRAISQAQTEQNRAAYDAATDEIGSLFDKMAAQALQQVAGYYDSLRMTVPPGELSPEDLMTAKAARNDLAQLGSAFEGGPDPAQRRLKNSIEQGLLWFDRITETGSVPDPRSLKLAFETANALKKEAAPVAAEPAPQPVLVPAIEALAQAQPPTQSRERASPWEDSPLAGRILPPHRMESLQIQAAQGVASSQFILGWHFLHGHNVPMDPIKAYKLFYMAFPRLSDPALKQEAHEYLITLERELNQDALLQAQREAVER